MLLYLLIGLIIGVIVAFILLRYLKNTQSEELAKSLESKLLDSFPGLLQSVSQQLITIADQKLSAEKQDIKTDLQNKKSAIEDTVKRLLTELEKSNHRMEELDKERIGSFRELKSELTINRKLTEQLSNTANSLKKVLANNQLRGHFGEQVAEDLLRMCGFVKGIDYYFNKTLKEGESRPDFTILMPDRTKVNIDVKFPYANLQKMTETEDKNSKQEYLKLFERDIKDKIRQVTTRDYINTQEDTVDFVILFIPNEMIFSFIYEKMHDIWNEGMKQKVIFAGPFNFTAILRLIRQSYANFKIQKDIHQIITYIKLFDEEFKKYNIEFEKIGSRIQLLSDQYDSVDRTRTKKLINTVEKITHEELQGELQAKQELLSDENNSDIAEKTTHQ